MTALRRHSQGMRCWLIRRSTCCCCRCLEITQSLLTLDTPTASRRPLLCFAACMGAAEAARLVQASGRRLEAPAVLAQLLPDAVSVIQALPVERPSHMDVDHTQYSQAWQAAGFLLATASSLAVRAAQLLPDRQRAAREAAVRWSILRLLPKLLAVPLGGWPAAECIAQGVMDFTQLLAWRRM